MRLIALMPMRARWLVRPRRALCAATLQALPQYAAGFPPETQRTADMPQCEQVMLTVLTRSAIHDPTIEPNNGPAFPTLLNPLFVAIVAPFA